MIPALPACSVVVAAVCAKLINRLSRGLRTVAVVGIAGIATIQLWPALSGKFVRSPVIVASALGAASPLDVWQYHPDLSTNRLYDAIVAVDRHVPSDGIVLLLFESRGLAFTRETYADVLRTTWSYLRQSPLYTSCLKGIGVSHMLINVSSIEYYQGRGIPPALIGADALAEFRQKCQVRVLWTNGFFALWQL